MRRRSLTGPLLLLMIGGLFLWRNLHPEAPVFDLLAQYWPFLLIAWGLLRLVEVVWSGATARRGSFTRRRSGAGRPDLHRRLAASGRRTEHGIHFNTGGLDVFGEQYDYPVSAHGAGGGHEARSSLKIRAATSR